MNPTHNHLESYRAEILRLKRERDNWRQQASLYRQRIMELEGKRMKAKVQISRVGMPTEEAIEVHDFRDVDGLYHTLVQGNSEETCDTLVRIAIQLNADSDPKCRCRSYHARTGLHVEDCPLYEESACPECNSRGFEPSKTGRGCEFCDGTFGGNPPITCPRCNGGNVSRFQWVDNPYWKYFICWDCEKGSGQQETYAGDAVFMVPVRR